MKTIHMLVIAAAMSGGLFGCQDNNGPRHEQVQEKTVTDANGNVVSHSEDKTDQKTTNNNGMNP